MPRVSDWKAAQRPLSAGAADATVVAQHARVLVDLSRIQDGQGRLEREIAGLRQQQADAADVLKAMQQELSGLCGAFHPAGRCGPLQRPSADCPALFGGVAPPECGEAPPEGGKAPEDWSVSCGGAASAARRSGEQDLAPVLSEQSLGDQRFQSFESGNVHQRWPSTGLLALPHAWPATIDIREAFANAREMTQESSQLFRGTTEALSRNILALRHKNSVASSLTEQTRVSMNSRSFADWRCLGVMDPTSLPRMVLDILSVVCLLCDLALLPVMLAWGLDSNGTLGIIMLCTLVFWTVDIFANFNSGFYLHGELEMRRSAIAMSYIKTSFALDLAVIGLDCTLQMDDSNLSDAIKFLRMTKVTRALRVVRILRLARLNRVIERMADRNMISATWSAVMEVLKILLFILWINHSMACMWYALGCHTGTDTGLHWLDTPTGPMASSEPLRQANHWYQYFTALHWSFTQMTPGSMKVAPLNTGERIFNVGCLLLGLLFFSTLVSMLSSKMARLAVVRQDQTNQLAQLRRFLRQSAVSPKLAVSVQKRVLSQMTAKKLLTETDVTCLKHLSLSLQTELHFELCRPHILRHAFFRLWAATHTDSLQRLCHEAMDMRVLMPEDNLFLAGHKAAGTYMVSRGCMAYLQSPTTSVVVAPTSTKVGEGTWLSEAALWADWVHVGTVEASVVSEVLCISASGFVAGLMKQPLMKRFCTEYAVQYHQRLVAAVPPTAPFPDDLACPFTDWSEIIVSMPLQMRKMVGMVAIQSMLKSTWMWGRKSIAQLHEEVMSGRSTVLQSSNDELQRVVAVAVLHLTRSDGRLFAQVGKLKDGDLAVACMLPGTKQGEGELPSSALRRALTEDVPFLVEGIELSRAETVEEVKDSETFRIPTKYVKTVHFASLQEDFAVPAVFLVHAHHAEGGCMHPDEIVLVGNHLSGSCYAWLLPHEFEHFSSPSGKHELGQWVSGILVHGGHGVEVCGHQAPGPNDAKVDLEGSGRAAF